MLITQPVATSTTVSQLRSRIGGRYRVFKGKKGVQDAYDQMADHYDASEHLNWTRRMEEGEERVIEIWLADLLTPVLDAGCGTGRYAGKIAERGRTVIAMDLSLISSRKPRTSSKNTSTRERSMRSRATASISP